MAVTTNRSRHEPRPDERRSARRREIIQGLMVLLALVLLALAARLPSG